MVKDLWEWLKICVQMVFPKCVIPQTLSITRMAGVAQMVERWIVIPLVEGSNPFARPI